MKETIKIPEIILNWRELCLFEEIAKNVKEGGINVPNKPGVYKVLDEKNETIQIGRSSNVRNRVKQGFVKGKTSHSTRKRMLNKKVNLQNLKIQWAETEWPNSVEEYLHKEFKKNYKRLPKFTKVT